MAHQLGSRLHILPLALPRKCSASLVRMALEQAALGPHVSIVNSQPPDTARVLSIQSHVVHGYVGNRCCVFPLQLLGLEVDFINSVQLSNHTGYPAFKGKVFDGEHLSELVAGLETNGLLPGYTHLLTGYIGSVSLLEAVVDVVHKLVAVNPNLTYLCDPVMGDEGRLYVSQELVSAYKERIVPLASIMVPNQFEAELLTGLKITSVATALAACDALHARGPHTVVITSLSLPDTPGTLHLLASTTQPQATGAAYQKLVMHIPRIHAYFTGTGDLLAALLLAWTSRLPHDLAQAVELAVAGLQAVLQDTQAHSGQAAAAERTAEVCRLRELRLIPNQHHLAAPAVHFKCQPASS